MRRREFSRVVLRLIAVVALAGPLWTICAAAANRFDVDERDGKVLEAVLLKLRDDPNFHFTKEEAARTNIVLVACAERLEKDEVLAVVIDLADLYKEEWSNAEARNHAASAASTNGVSFKGLKLPARTLIGERNFSELTFAENYPTAKGWVRAALPGYSKDGKRALVCTTLGPTYHGAVATMILEEADGKWIVRLHRILWGA